MSSRRLRGRRVLPAPVPGRSAARPSSSSKTASPGFHRAVESLEPRRLFAEVFLQGNFIEVGIHDAGSFGTEEDAPSGFHPMATFDEPEDRRLGFVADHQADGWDVGDPPQTGDFFVPGTPEEGWMVEWTGSGGTEVGLGNFGANSDFDIPQTSLTNTSSGEIQSAVWTGTAVSPTNADEELEIVQTVRFHEDNLFFVIRAVMTNTGTTTLSSLEYMRSVDPDPEQALTGGTFSTDNYVLFQPPHAEADPDVPARPGDNTAKALVVAKGLDFGITLGLGAVDPRATVSTEGFANRNPDAIIDSPVMPEEATPNRADEAISLAYRLGDLAPGQSVTVEYVYVLREEDLDAGLEELGSVTILEPSGTVSGDDIPFRASTTRPAETESMEFFVGTTSVGTDTDEDGDGIFEVTFDSTAFGDGSVDIRAVATFDDDTTDEDTSTITIANGTGDFEVTRFVIVNARTGADIRTIEDGDHVFLNALPRNVNVRAEVVNGDTEVVESVVFGYDVNSGTFNDNFRVEDEAVYALFANRSNGSYRSGRLKLGSHTLTATPFTEDGGAGTAGGALSVNFEVFQRPTSAEIAIVSFTLINADTGEEIQKIEDGDVLSLADLPENLNIRADTNENGAGSVVFGYDQEPGDFNDRARVENVPAHSLFGNRPNGTFRSRPLTVGEHTLTATPHTDERGRGSAGTALTINFTVAEDGASATALRAAIAASGGKGGTLSGNPPPPTAAGTPLTGGTESSSGGTEDGSDTAGGTDAGSIVDGTGSSGGAGGDGSVIGGGDGSVVGGGDGTGTDTGTDGGDSGVVTPPAEGGTPGAVGDPVSAPPTAGTPGTLPGEQTTAPPVSPPAVPPGELGPVLTDPLAEDDAAD